MTKVLQATCTAGIVKVGALPVPSATVLSEGVASSEGLLFLDEELKTYIPRNSQDLKANLDGLTSSLTDLCAALTQVATTLTAIGAGMTGPTTAPPPTLAVQVALITSKVTSITATNVTLTTLKGALK